MHNRDVIIKLEALKNITLSGAHFGTNWALLERAFPILRATQAGRSEKIDCVGEDSKLL